MKTYKVRWTVDFGMVFTRRVKAESELEARRKVIAYGRRVMGGSPVTISCELISG